MEIELIENDLAQIMNVPVIAIVNGINTVVVPSEDPYSKIAEVTDWGENTDGGDFTFSRAIFPTNIKGIYELYTPSSKHSGLYATKPRSIICSKEKLVEKYDFLIEKKLNEYESKVF